MPPIFFETAAQFRAWLEQHHAAATELFVGFRTVGSGLQSMTWSESVDEALCFGWIDGVRRRLDHTAYVVRFTPRQRSSIWSRVNVERALRLTAQGRMRPPGTAAFEARSEKKAGVHAFEQVHPAELEPDELRLFKRNKAAWRYFEAVAPSYRRVVTFWVMSAKRPQTRARRLAELVQACAEHRRLLK